MHLSTHISLLIPVAMELIQLLNLIDKKYAPNWGVCYVEFYWRGF